jgi:hypothetical protein
MEVSGQLHAPAASPAGKEPSVSIGQEAGLSPEPVGTMWRREKSYPYRDSNSVPSAVQPEGAIPSPATGVLAILLYCSLLFILHDIKGYPLSHR